jgi:hypothetical protein
VAVDPIETLDIHHDGRPVRVCLAAVDSAGANREIERRLAELDRRFIGIVSADLGVDAAVILRGLCPSLGEIVCFDSATDPVVLGTDFALRALEQFGFGQDFVFTVAKLEDALDYAIGVLVDARRTDWEGEFVVVAGPRTVVERARRHLGPRQRY